ncbi:MAG: hypothetical protein ISR47_08335 [Rhodospirillales bacterium]|nr:hypothetical protein [Rhodospirillales bacterium]
MAGYSEYFISHMGQVSSLVSVGTVWFALSFVGGMISGRERFREGDFIFGWAAVCLLFTIGGVFTGLSFSVIAITCAGLAIVGCGVVWRRDGLPVSLAWGRILVLAAPLLLLVSGMVASQWDEFSHWLASARFLLATDGFPDAANPNTGGSFPAYPYAWPLISYLTGRIAGGLIENTGPLVNVLLLLSFGLLVMRVIAVGLGKTWNHERLGWSLCALAGLTATAFNPTFVQKVILTAYADTPSAVALGFATVLSWFMLEALAQGEDKSARRFSWQVGLALVLVVNLKQSTLVLFVMLIAAILAVALRDPKIRIRDFLRLLPGLLLPPLLIYAVWRYHVASELAGREFTIRPLSAWAFDILPQILWSMLYVALKKSLYFGIMVIATATGLMALFRFRNSFDRLAVLAGTLFGGYNAFLLFAYVAAFSQGEASRAASYWRYNMHLGAVCVAFAALGLAILWRKHLADRFDPARLKWVPIVLLIAAPFIFAHKLRFDTYPPVPHFRTVGAEVTNLLPAGSRLIVVDPQGTGESAIITRYEGGGSFKMTGFISAFTRATAENIAKSVAHGDPNYALIHSVTPAVREVLGANLKSGQSTLLKRNGQAGWSELKSWPRDPQ